MKVFIAGIQGYLGWSLACHLASKGHQVGGLDAGHRAQWVEQQGSQSAIPVHAYTERHKALEEVYGLPVPFYPCDMRDMRLLTEALRDFKPDAVVHLAEQSSAPFSQIDAFHAKLTQEINVLGSLNLLWVLQDMRADIHLVKLGTMGEYGTPGCRIPEGVFPEGSVWAFDDNTGLVEIGDLDGLPFPRSPGSYYHVSKCQDTLNVAHACKTQGLRATDVMQGVVYGTRIDAMSDDPRLRTRFDFDGVFGTVINRFCAQAVIGAPITPYGAGHQKRGFLPLCDSMQCLTLLLDNPPEPGEHRQVNQIEGVYEIGSLAHLVADKTGGKVQHIKNPRKELEDHEYEVDHDTLTAMGYLPTSGMDTQLEQILADLKQHKDRIEECRSAITPTVTWEK